MSSYPPDMISYEPCPALGLHTLVDGEYLVQCPYDKYHKVLNGRVERHLEKCRRNYVQKFRKQRKMPYRQPCVYNPNHLVNLPELYLHEYTCSNRDRLTPLQFVAGMDREQLNRALSGNLDPAELDIDSDDDEPIDADFMERAKNEYLPIGGRYSHLDFHPDKLVHDLIKAGSVEALFPELARDPAEVRWADPAVTKAKGISPFKQPSVVKLSQTEDPLFFDRYRNRRVAPRVSRQPLKQLTTLKEGPEEEDDVDSEEYWAKNDAPHFDWWKHQWTYKLKGEGIMKYPPGLSKAQRKVWTKWNAERLKLEQGIVGEDMEFQ